MKNKKELPVMIEQGDGTYVDEYGRIVNLYRVAELIESGEYRKDDN